MLKRRRSLPEFALAFPLLALATGIFGGPTVAAPVISSLEAGSITATSAQITWTTDEASDSQVFYRESGQTEYQETAIDPALVTTHQVELSDLEPARTYQYHVRSADGAGDASVSSPDETFTTEPETIFFEIPMPVPRLRNLQTLIAATEGTVAVVVDFRFNLQGKLLCAGTFDGELADCKSTLEKVKNGWSYRISMTEPGSPKSTAKISGLVSSDTAKCEYQGAKGKVNLPENPVLLQVDEPIVAQVTLTLAVDTKGKVSGSATTVSGYGSDPSLPGILFGKLKDAPPPSRIQWTVIQTPRRLEFAGELSGDDYVGTLQVKIPPVKTTLKDFHVPAQAQPPAPTATFQGRTTHAGLGTGDPAKGVVVEIHSDLDGDGTIASGESVSGETESDGSFSETYPVVQDRPVVITWSELGFVPFARTYRSVTPDTVVVANPRLDRLDTLVVSEGTARSEDGTLGLGGLPALVVALDGLVLDPRPSVDEFPGSFADADGNLLVSTVFAALTARDGFARDVTDPVSGVTIRARVPVESWPTLGDLTGGNGQIDVPLYRFDSGSGEWLREAADGWIEDAEGNRLPESELPAIREGSHAGSVFAAGPISHLSWWGVAWPVASHQCIAGQLRTESGEGVPNAVVWLRGLTYTGIASPVVTDSGGAFCVDALRSEQSEEDLDRDGVAGETHQVRLLVTHGNEGGEVSYYGFGPFDLPRDAASCDTSGCLSLPDLRLDAAHKIEIRVCSVEGQVVYSGTSAGRPPGIPAGTAIEGATVAGGDTDAQGDTTACADVPCQLSDTTDAEGRFTLAVPVLSGVELFAYRFSSDPVYKQSEYQGEVSAEGCPSEPLIVPVDYTESVNLLLGLYDTGGTSVGSLTVSLDGASCYLVGGMVTYTGSSDTVPDPTAVGTWFNLDLVTWDSQSSAWVPAGTITFTIDAIEADGRISGSWSTTTDPILSGTWRGLGGARK